MKVHHTLSLPVVLVCLLALLASSTNGHSDATAKKLEEQNIAGMRNLSNLQSLTHANAKVRRWKPKLRDGPASVTFKYDVPPSKADQFIDHWTSLADSTRGEHKLVYLNLQKVNDDNVGFFAFGQWEDEDAFKDHLEQDYTQKFFDYVLAEDIPMQWHPLFKMADDVDKYADGSKNRKPRCPKEAHVLVCYVVPPSLQDDFIFEWRQAADGVADEKAASIYALRKVATNNMEWYVYGVWDTMEDYYYHFHSKHIRKLRKWDAKHDVVWKRHHLYDVEALTSKSRMAAQ